ncbi:MAG: DUF368 domain-containing protein [Erysipelotrichaceae bacterium]
MKTFIGGVLMGIANVIPGVSGGTVAVIMGFYDRLLECITLNFKKLWENRVFIVLLGLGLVVGVFGVSKLISYCLNNYNLATCFTFLGIIIGSIPAILGQVKNKGKIANILGFLISFGIMIALFFANGDKNQAIMISTFSITNALILFVAMFFATITMLVPGISGSLILMVLGLYSSVFGFIIPNLYWPLLIVCGLGVVFGLLLGAKGISIMLKKFPDLTYSVILGLIFGSLINLFPGVVFNMEMVIGLVLFVVGAIVTFKMAKM